MQEYEFNKLNKNKTNNSADDLTMCRQNMF